MATRSTCIAWERILQKALAELAIAIDLQPQTTWAQIEIRGICEDTRRLNPGELFVAISGRDRDGRGFINQAVERGAAAVVSEDSLDLPVPVLTVQSARAALARLSAAFHDHPTRDLFAVGVTGTNGKTTVSHWTAELLGRGETRLLSTVQNSLSGISGLTTPSSSVIQRLARQAAADGMDNLVLEASSAGISQDRVSHVDFDACVFTNFSPEHLNHHGGVDAYRSAKLKLFENLNPEAWAVVNADDPMHSAIAEATSAQVLSYGIHAEADLRASDIHASAYGSQFTLVTREGETQTVSVPLPGRHNVANALAAIGVGMVKGVPLGPLSERLAAAVPIPGRIEFFRRTDGALVVIDFAHNASSLEVMLRLLRSEYARVVVVFGCPGDSELKKRTAMGAVSGRWADVVVLTSDNPKNEDPTVIADAILAGMASSAVPVTFVLDRARAIQLALSQASAGDVVLLAGKGHETEQLIGNKRVRYSDASVLRELGFVAGH